MQTHRSGYIALLSILMVAAIAASTVLILFTTSVNQVQNVADTEKGLTAIAAADSCAERALEYVRETGSSDANTIITAIGEQTVGKGTCEIISVDVSGFPNYILKTKGVMSDGSGTVEKFVLVKFSAPVDETISLISWEELAS